VDIEPIDNRIFEAEVALRRLPGVAVSSGWRTPADYRFGRRQLAVASDNIVLGIVMKGRARVVQMGRDLTIDQGGAAMMTTSDPGYHALYDGGGHLAVQLPRNVLSAALPDIESRLMRPFPPDSDALKLVIAYAKAALDLDPSASHELQRRIATDLSDLVVFLAGQHEREAEASVARSVGAARLRVTKLEIEARLGQRDLSAETLAATQQVSPDYVRKLFRQEGTSFSDYLLSRRSRRPDRSGSPRPAHRVDRLPDRVQRPLLFQSRLPAALRQVALRRPQGWRMSLNGILADNERFIRVRSNRWGGTCGGLFSFHHLTQFLAATRL
jgi:AraC-like DNA-binding protein